VNSNRDRPLKPKYMVAFQQGRVADKSTPDVDNLSKFVLDALQNIIYCDDSQVVKCGAVKVLDTKAPHNGRIFVSVRCAEPHDFPNEFGM
jgi:Holliday junction resolvase RusA-like endonuclease